jgi:MFS family permease
LQETPRPFHERAAGQHHSRPSSTSAGALGAAIRALHHRNYRLYFTGQSVSLIGSWMARIATSWLVYRLSGSTLMLGLVGFAGQLPTFLLAPFAGVWVDRWNRHRLLIATQILAMVQSLALAALALAGIITIPEILALSVFQGLINAFDMPGRQTFLIEMVEDRADLGNAIALNSSMVNMARLLGPSLAGIIIAAVGEGYCFLIDGLSYIAVIASLLAMRLKPSTEKRATRPMLTELRDGWQYVTRFAPIRSILLLLALISLVGMPYTILMPVFAVKVLGGGAHTLGFLMAAVGTGALAAALRLATRKSVLGLGRVVVASAAIFGLGLIAFAFSHVLWLSLLLLFAAGFGVMQQMAASNTIVQTVVSGEKRGRVMSYYVMAFTGMAPFGSLLAGSAAHYLGAPATVVLGGSFCVLGAAWFHSQLKGIRALLRPVYIELGILPEIAAGLGTASDLQSPPEN